VGRGSQQSDDDPGRRGRPWPTASGHADQLSWTQWPGPVEVRLDDRVVLETTGALRLQAPGAPPRLAVPWPGPAWTVVTAASPAPLPGIGPAHPARATMPADQATGPSGQRTRPSDIGAVGWRPASSPPGAPWLVDTLVLDDQALTVLVVDDVAGDGTTPPTTKRFPTWGDVDDLVDILDVRSAGPDRFTTVTRPGLRRAVVEGSQMLGQAIVAARRRTGGRRVAVAHMAFVRAASVDRPLDLTLTPITDGRTMTALTTRVDQDGRTVGSGQLLLHDPSTDVVRHQVAPDPVPPPAQCPPLDMGVTGRDIRVVDGAYTDDPDAPVGPPVIDAWVRFRRLGDDLAVHSGLLTQFTGHMAIAAALRPHAGVGQAQAHRTLSTAINAITVSLHDEVRVDQWLRYHHHATFAGDGMTHSECRVHTEDGALVASFVVEAMVRPFAGGRVGDDRTAL
jgi:acyl-CoA thioesterase-2